MNQYRSKFSTLNEYEIKDISLFFQRKHPNGLYSLSMLSILLETYNITSFCLKIIDTNGYCQALILLYTYKGMSFNKVLYCPRDGLFFENLDALQFALAELELYSRKLGSSEMSISCSVKNDTFNGYNFHEKYVLGIDLSISQNDLWACLRDKTRNSIRKSDKYMLKITNDYENIDIFYHIYKTRMNSKNVLIHRLDYIKKLIDAFDSNVNIYVSFYNNKPIASIIVIYYQSKAYYLFSGMLEGYEKMCPIQSLLWHAIVQCYHKNIQYFDMGESTLGSGTYKFKRWFGAEPKSVFYYKKSLTNYSYMGSILNIMTSYSFRLINKIILSMGLGALHNSIMLKEKLKNRLI